MSTAIIPYNPPQIAIKFIQSEVERNIKNGTIKLAQLILRPSAPPSLSESIESISVKVKKIGENSETKDGSDQSKLSFDPSEVLRYGSSGQETIKKMANVLLIHSLSIIYNHKTKKFIVTGSSGLEKEVIEKIFAKNSYIGWQPLVLPEVDECGNRLVALKCIVKSSSALKIIPSQVLGMSSSLNGDEIAEVFQSEAGFTIGTDKKPILATYGCGPCVAVGGFEPVNKIAFVVHFSSVDEVRKCGGLIFYNISKLAKEKIEGPIQLHLRGGFVGQSEALIEAINVWMRLRDDLPMEIASQEILLRDMGCGKNLSIDSRTGEVAEYIQKNNPKSRYFGESEIWDALTSGYRPNIKLAYAPNNKSFAN